MSRKKFIIITNAPREYKWKDSYTYNLTGKTDITEKIANNHIYRKNELCLIHPAIVEFYEKHKTPFQEKITKGACITFPGIIDKTQENSSFPASISFPANEIPALICETKIKRGILGEEYLNQINAEYRIIPLKTEEFLEIKEDNLETILKTYERNNLKLTSEDKSEVRQKLAVLKSFDIYLQEKAIRIRDIPIEISRRVGEIPPESLKKYTI